LAHSRNSPTTFEVPASLRIEIPNYPLGTTPSREESITRTGNFLLETFEIKVYPSNIEVHGPLARGINSVVEQYYEHIDRFLRVRFLDNNDKPLRREVGTSLDAVIQNRVVQVLRNQTQLLCPSHRVFEFLGYSVSSLKKRKAVWFFRNDGDGLTADSIRSEIGNWNNSDPLTGKLARSPLKWGARVALAFTESYSMGTLSGEQWTHQNDTVNLSTDGCGLISKSLCDDINRKLAPLGYKVRQMRSHQIG
jgi:RNA-dependent RNA polymerase